MANFTLSNGRFGLACERREFLRQGAGLCALGVAWNQARAERAQFDDERTTPRSVGRAKSCILVYLLGGPSHLDMFDLKPEAPAEVRGPFQPIDTNLPGVRICEHLPRLATMADRYALVRSVSHPNSNHTPMIYYTLTGKQTAEPLVDNDVRPPLRTDAPHFGSIVSLFKNSGAMPGYVAIPEVAVRSSTSGEFKRARSPLRGGSGGFLGAACDPLCINGEPGDPGAVPALSLPEGVSVERFSERARVLDLLNRARESSQNSAYDEIRSRALVLSGAANAAGSPLFSIAQEPVAVRERYGHHRFGQAMLLARRLTEAGVPFVAVHFNEMTVCDGWDTHGKNFEGLQTELLPYLDQGLSALLEDLDQRGRLDETLVACLGEFGRTPKINANAGRDHWGPCSTTLLAGGGIRAGQTYGASDSLGAYPKSDSVDPVDIQATMYHCLGMQPQSTIYDALHRPHAICLGQPVRTLLA